MHYFIPTLLFLWLSLSLYDGKSKDVFSVDSALIETYILQGKSWTDSAKHDSAIQYFQQAREVIEPHVLNGQNKVLWEKFLSIRIEIAASLLRSSKFSESIEELEAILEAAKKNLAEPNTITAQSITLIGRNHQLLKSYQEALLYFQQGMEIRRDLHGEYHASIGTIHYRLGQVYQSLGDKELARQAYHESLHVREKVHEKQHLDVAWSHFNLGLLYDDLSQYTLAIEHHQKALQIRLQILPSDHSDLFSSYNNLGISFKNSGKYQEAIHQYESALAIKFKTSRSSKHKMATIYTNIGSLYNKMGKFEEALSKHESALAIWREMHGEEHRYIALAYLNIGSVYDNLGAYEAALENHYKSLEIRKKVLGETHPKIGSNYHNIGVVSTNIGDYQTALKSYQQSLRIWKKAFGDKHAYVAWSYNNVGSVYYEIGELEQAFTNMDKALQIRLGLYGERHADVGNSYNNLGAVFEKWGDYVQAEKYFKKGLSIRRASFGEPHFYVAWSYNNLARIYDLQKSRTKALAMIQSALQSNTVRFKDSSILANPSTSDGVLSIRVMLVSLKYKAQILFDRYSKQSADLEDLQLARQTFERAFQMMEMTLNTYQRKSDKKELLQNGYEILEGLMQVYAKLWQVSGDQTYVMEMFSVAERSKSVLLRKTLEESKAQRFAGIPAAVIDHEIDLRRQIDRYKGSLSELELDADSIHSEEESFFRSEIFRLSQSRDSLLVVMEEQHPAYFQLKHQLTVPSLGEIQEMLPDSSMVLEYFLTQEKLYCLAIASDSIGVIERDTDSLSSLLSAFRQSISQPASFLNDEEKSTQFHQFAQQAHTLFQLLIPSTIHSLSGIKELIIIPDGELGYIPFDLLLSDNPSDQAINGLQYQTLPYLLKSCQVRYEFSSSLLLENSADQGSFAQTYLGFAPEYGEGDLLSDGHSSLRSMMDLSRASFSPLVHNQPEVVEVSRLWNGKALLGKQASLQAFLHSASDNQILHLATHAFVHDSLPLLSGFVFSPSSDSIGENILYSYELYNQQLNTELAILSACETGYGKIQRGEGIMSLARAFKYAGCPNILMTLWTADDRASGELVAGFSRYLKSGMEKDEALRQAKLDYIRDGSKKHPFYWANFVLVGDDVPLKSPNHRWTYCILALGGIIVMTLGLRMLQ